jgi:hypothetical protein
MWVETSHAAFSKSPLCTSWPLARAVAFPQRRHDRDRAEHAAHHVVHRRARAQRTAHGPRHVREAAHHLHHFIERGALLVRAGQEALQRAIDEPRVHLRERLVAKPLRLERAGTEILEEHVRIRAELLRRRDAFRRREIECHALLVAAERGEESGAGALEIPRGIALAFGLDLDHFRAQVGEHEAGSRPHDHVGELDHADAFEGQHRQRAAVISMLSINRVLPSHAAASTTSSASWTVATASALRLRIST